MDTYICCKKLYYTNIFLNTPLYLFLYFLFVSENMYVCTWAYIVSHTNDKQLKNKDFRQLLEFFSDRNSEFATWKFLQVHEYVMISLKFVLLKSSDN